MILKRIAVPLLSVAAVAALLGCNATPRPPQTAAAPAAEGGERVDLRAMYAELGQAGGKVFTLAPESSAVRIYAFRAGRAAKVGHNHVLSAPQFTGFFYLPSGGAASGRFDLVFRLDQLEIDNPQYRSALGAAFSSVLSADAVQSTREHLLGADGLQAERYPFVHVRSLQISGEAPKFAARVELEMRGRKTQLWVPVDVEGLPDRLSASGSFVLHQTDFGVQPFSVLGGLLAVQDEVVLDFKLTGVCRADMSRDC
jgi:polyisoprenoid-binding protein YceI